MLNLKNLSNDALIQMKAVLAQQCFDTEETLLAVKSATRSDQLKQAFADAHAAYVTVLHEIADRRF